MPDRTAEHEPKPSPEPPAGDTAQPAKTETGDHPPHPSVPTEPGIDTENQPS